ncbi:hypothetical protein CDEST_02581 [Colletotrichum destructivum]|uniref:Uncharacterized protein n=1 Tax=Colletotrichum destructivum TaxID=34406 RepID=A0AAX4I361_9PEZI|nr:hypothetical protein CDEST_02581 [Colletotrichum destructivum]
MRYNQLILSLFLLITFVIALPTPAPVEAVATQVAADKTKTKTGNKKTTTKTANNNTKRPVSRAADCTAAKNLADGIKRNMDIQDKELRELEAVRKIVTSKDASKKQKEFTDAKNALVRTVKEGMSVRENNESMATKKKDNTVIKGLKTVADAQKKELKQVQDLNLKNTKAIDDITKLETEFKEGKKKNGDNRRDALKGC